MATLKGVFIFILLASLGGVISGKERRVAIFVRERCEDNDVYNKEVLFKRAKDTGKKIPNVDFEFIEDGGACGDGQGKGEVRRGVETAWGPQYAALVGSFPLPTCDLLAALARHARKPFLSWDCPMNGWGGWRVEPTLAEAAAVLSRAALALRFTSALLLSTGVEGGWWWRLAHELEAALGQEGVSCRHLHVPHARALARSLARLQPAPPAVILCASSRTGTGLKILESFDANRIIPSVILVIDLYKFVPGTKSFRFQNKETTETGDKMMADEPIASLSQRHNSSFSDNSAANGHSRNSRKQFASKTISVLLSNEIRSSTNRMILQSTPVSFEDGKIISAPSPIKYGNSIPHKSPVKESVYYSSLPPLNSLHSTQENNFYESSTIEVAQEPRTVIITKANVNKNSPYPTFYQLTTDNKMKWRDIKGKDRYIRTPENKVVIDKQEAYASSAFRSRKQETTNGLNGIYKAEDTSVTKDLYSLSLTAFTQPTLTKKVLMVTERIKSSDPVIAHFFKNSAIDKDKVKENQKHKRRKRNVLGNTLFSNLSKSLQDCILFMSDRKLDVKKFYIENDDNRKNVVLDKIIHSLRLLEKYFDGVEQGIKFEYYFYDRVFESSSINLLRLNDIVPSWRFIMKMESSVVDIGGDAEEIVVNRTNETKNFKEWVSDIGFPEEELCEGDVCPGPSIITTPHIFAIIAISLVLSSLLAGSVIMIRSALVRRRVSKRPSKVVLMASDFVFPQVADARRVDEGMEAMLCCFLQQLQEFGGPEVEKPDILKGSIGSIKGLQTGAAAPTAVKGPSSNASIARSTFIFDPRTRYNGDLVQMKYLSHTGTFELKRKSADLLFLMQSLRHENLNPFIGCLCEPSKPALVFEYCSRGSLEDVLVADDIKLDWTFRLSLLTDLVRGMRYLHGTTLRVHGHLMSRNCVVDARWVLKLTDYGLPAFYRAQGTAPPHRTARDLLWTAPELLRDQALRSRGTQPGDVYSFAIVMQEVVVRGEPFCMLALTPEEIIEKVKRPPPLIRPSVSKGAAPPEAINIMRQCWTEQPDMRPDFHAVHDLFRKLNQGRKVNFIDTMFQMLEKYSNNLEELIKERTEQLDMEKKKTEQLLNRMLPSYVAEKLKLGMPVDPEEFSEVSIYFSDIVGFTQISAHSSPFQVVALLNDLYTTFDATINHYNVYKVETIGDAYMVVGGLPVRTRDHAEQVATMALHLLHHAGRFRIRHLPSTPLHLRIGLHTGPCCAGVVGLTMPRYCLFGDTVNTASRMESTGAAWRIHLSAATRDKLEAAGGYCIEYRGPTEVKGKGRMHTYWLLGKAGFDKPLPTPPPIRSDDSCFELEGGALSTNTALPARAEDEVYETGMPPSDTKLQSPGGDEGGDAGVSKPAERSHREESAGWRLAGCISDELEVDQLLSLHASSLSLAPRPRKRTTLEEDLSTPYNHYRCLSPSDGNLSRAGRQLRRQFSLDRADEGGGSGTGLGGGARLCKQNSAGAVELERIEEVRSPRRYRKRPRPHPPVALSVSAESLHDTCLFHAPPNSS